MTDLLYIVRQSGWGYDEELRYSLRSVEKHARNIGRVFVCGDIPEWLSDEVITISCDNPFDRKAKNLTYRLNYAMEHSDIGERFLLSSDDIFHLQDFDCDNYPHYWKNGEEIIYYGTNKIARIINEARTFMQVHKLSVQDYGGGHCLHHVERGVWDENAEKIAYAQQMTYGVPVDLMLGAFYDKKHKPVIYQVRKDIKIGAGFDLAEIAGADCFSMDDNPQHWGGDLLLKKLYPNKCKYER